MSLSETIKALSFLGLSVYAILHGWKMVTQPPQLYWHDRFVITLIRLIKGTESAENLKNDYLDPGRLRTIGILNLVTGLILLASLIYWLINLLG